MLEIIIVGVGGQGTLLASRILGNIALNRGLDVKVSEVHGMSQRGGSVITHVRLGGENEKVATPLVGQRSADFILAFERLEALRALPYLKDGGVIVSSEQEIMPMPVITGAAAYPHDALETASKHAKVVSIDALSAAKDAGSLRSANVALIGVLARLLPFEKAEIRGAVEASVPKSSVEANLRAFDIGYGKVEDRII